MNIVSYLSTNIFKQPTLFIGLIAFIGLLLQRKGISNVIKGTFKTIIGVIILFVGVNLIGTSVSPLSSGLGTLYNLPIENQFDSNMAWSLLSEYGSTIGMVLMIAFVMNLLIARFTPIKSIFLTGHIFFWMSYIFVLSGVELGLSGWQLLLFASVFLTIYIIVMPWLTKPFVKTITGSDDFTIGHTASIFIIIGGCIGKIVGDKSKSTENIKIPNQLDFFRDTTISTSLIMFLLYIAVGFLIGPSGRSEAFEPAISTINTIGGMKYDFFTFSLMGGLTFGAGLTILLTGVRLMLSELIPAFSGISDYLIPNAIPALDVPMLFPFAPNALMIGFLISLTTSIVAIILLASTGILPYAVIPLVTACFYDVAPGAIAANAEGGKTAVVITGVVGGILMVLFIVGSISLTFNTSAGFIQLYGGNDFSIWSLISGYVGRLFIK